MKKILLVVAFFISQISSNAFAEGRTVYFGGEIGLSTLTNNSSSDTGLGADLIGGLNFNDYLGAELNIGGSSPVGSLTIFQFGASVVGNLPIGKGLGLYASYGYDYSMIGSSGAGKGSLSGVNPVASIGVSLTNGNDIIRLGYDVLDYNNFAPNEKTTYLKIGMIHKF